MVWVLDIFGLVYELRDMVMYGGRGFSFGGLLLLLPINLLNPSENEAFFYFILLYLLPIYSFCFCYYYYICARDGIKNQFKFVTKNMIYINGLRYIYI